MSITDERVKEQAGDDEEDAQRNREDQHGKAVGITRGRCGGGEDVGRRLCQGGAGDERKTAQEASDRESGDESGSSETCGRKFDGERQCRLTSITCWTKALERVSFVLGLCQSMNTLAKN